MTSSEIAVRADHPAPTVLTNEQLTYIANTEFVPTGLRGNLPAILACVATGRALGIDDMTAIRSIHIIEGKATFSAELMVQLVRRAGHSITGEVTEGKATVTGTRIDNGDSMSSTWTLDMAERAGLRGKGNWKKYPEAMLWARAVSQLCRMLFADCFAGATYTTEELGAEETGEDGVPFVDPLASEIEEAAWAAGSSGAGPVDPEASSETSPPPVVGSDGAPDEIPSDEAAVLERTLRTIAEKMGKLPEVEAGIEKHRGDIGWLQTAIARAEAASGQEQFPIPESARA